MKFSVDKKILVQPSSNMKKSALPSLFSSVLWESKDSFPYRLRQIICQVVSEVVGKDKALKFEDIKLEHPLQENYGDYATNIAMILAGRLQMKPYDLAKKIAGQLDKYIRANQKLTISSDSKVSPDGIINPSDILEKIEVGGNGFINLWLQKHYLISLMSEVLKEKDGVITSQMIGKKFMVEFAHPNTHKAFHIGHLRNISTGESVVRLLEALGCQVIRANYQGDVGMHIAKALYGLLYLPEYKDKIEKVKDLHERVTLLGEAYAAGSRVYEEDKEEAEIIKDLNYLIYASAQKFQQERGIVPSSTDYMQFVKGEKVKLDKVYDLWKMTRQWSLDYFEKIYKRVYTHYDRYYFEGECLSGVDIAKDAVKKGILEVSSGAIVFRGKPYGLDTRVFVNNLGLPTYEAKELALAQKQFSEFGSLDKNIHVVGPEQASFFKVTFKTEELLYGDLCKDKQYHLLYGWVRLKKGKMSSRLGNVVLGEWLLDEAKVRIKKIVEKVRRKVGEETEGDKTDTEEIVNKVAVAAVKYSMLKVSPSMDIAFDIDESISFEGDSGPYLMYTYARCKSVIRKSKVIPIKSGQKSKVMESDGKAEGANFGVRVQCKESIQEENIGKIGIGDFPQLLNPEELSLLRTLYRFPEVVSQAARTLSPNLICCFLFDLAQKYNLFYNKHSILSPQISSSLEPGTYNLEPIINFRLSLTSATARIIKKSLYLLGIETVERM